MEHGAGSKELATASSSDGGQGAGSGKATRLQDHGQRDHGGRAALSVNGTVGQARRLPIHRMASGSACPTNPLSEVC